MGLLNNNKKQKFDIKDIHSTVQMSGNNAQTIQVIEATVLEVGDDEAENGFSYKYSFTNPVTGKTTEAYDYVQTVQEGEQIFDVGETITAIFTSYTNDVKNFIITRQMIFPKIDGKRKKRRRILKIFYIVLIALAPLLCCISSMIYAAMQEMQQMP